jgi:ATP adenylyltransferase
MDYLPAPWRARYVQTPHEETGCIFCTSVQAGRDREKFILYRGKYNFVILNRYPYTPGHIMIAPYRHLDSIIKAGKAAAREMMDLLQESLRILERRYKPQGFNSGMNMGRAGGAGISEHYHMHCLPRWTGDSNFMPLTGDTRVFIETLDQTYERLLPDFRDLASRDSTRGSPGRRGRGGNADEL